MTRDKYNEEDLTYAEAHRLFSYNLETGLLTRKVSTNNRNRCGDVLSPGSHGYVSFMHKGRNFKAHRLIWMMVHGCWPSGQIDHINGNRSDNRINNLRDVTPQQNCWNRSTNGVGTLKKAGRYFSYFDHQGVREYLGMFKTYEKAYDVSQNRRKEILGEFYRA